MVGNKALDPFTMMGDLQATATLALRPFGRSVIPFLRKRHISFQEEPMRFIGKTALLICGMGMAAGAMADEDLTGSFVPGFSNMASGTSVSIGWTEYDSRCLAKVPLTGACLSGERERATGEMRLTDLTAATGEIWRKDIVDHARHTTVTGYDSTLYFAFHYDAHTSAEKYLNDVLVDHPWGDISPSGTAKVWLTACSGNDWHINFQFEADPGHDDKPNWFVVNYLAPVLKQRLAGYVSQLTPGSHVEFNDGPINCG